MLMSSEQSTIDSSNASDANHEQQVSVLQKQNAELDAQVKSLQKQLDAFKKMLFGKSSEKRQFNIPGQPGLFDDEEKEKADGNNEHSADESAPSRTITYERGASKKGRADNCVTAEGLRFGDDVPVKRITLTPPEIEGLSEDQYEVIGVGHRYRLAQQQASYTVIEYEIPQIKLKDDGKLVSAGSPASVLERSIADVSLLAGVLVDKFSYHLPLYRQHQRIEAAGVTLARSTLTNLVKRSILLLEPIVEAQWRHVLQSKVIAMDETPVKAGRSKKKKGKMHQGYFWPIYGDWDEVVFTYSESRARRVIEEILGEEYAGILICDGYKAYASYAARCEALTFAQCWTHTRRQFVEARDDEPVLVDEMLDMIGVLYGNEKYIRKNNLSGDEKREYRQTHSGPVIDQIMQWVKQKLEEPSRLPKAPFTQALGYLFERDAALRVFLDEPDVPIDTNHLERTLRVIPMGRKNWNFCWTELGAEHVGIIQSLISTCKLHNIDPYTYLVDVLQRVSEHPSKDVIELTPRVWKTRFADSPLKSDLAVAV